MYEYLVKSIVEFSFKAETLETDIGSIAVKAVIPEPPPDPLGYNIEYIR